MTEQGHLDPADVVSIISNLTADDDAFIVGGQATNLWAWYYRNDAAYLKEEGPFTSVDIDYFGKADVADKLAEALGGKVFRPGPDSMNTPNTAIVEVNLDGKKIHIDFLNNVLGVRKEELGRGISSLGIMAEVNGAAKPVAVLLMHPLSCLKSRIANMMHPATRRRDATARRQAHAAYHVTRAHIDHALEDGDNREATDCLQGIFEYLRRDEFGRKAHLETPVDPLGILTSFQDDARLDQRHRDHNLASHIAEIQSFRTGLAERLSRSASGRAKGSEEGNSQDTSSRDAPVAPGAALREIQTLLKGATFSPGSEDGKIHVLWDDAEAEKLNSFLKLATSHPISAKRAVEDAWLLKDPSAFERWEREGRQAAPLPGRGKSTARRNGKGVAE